ncbi:MAG: thioredoxin [Lachnospiraceae bacterium]|nr:thioredoxin [Lachnospiraceae bacterium]
MVKKINDKQFDEVVNSEVAVVDFSATWCGPCRMLAPVIDEVSEEMSDVNFFNIDVDECQALAIKYGVSSIPAVMVFKKGEKVAQNVGFVPKDAIKQFVEANK